MYSRRNKAAAHPPVGCVCGKMGAKKIVYISCNPETLARDAKFLLSDGWRMGTVYPFDLFCRTGHVECCTSFEKF